MTKAQFREWIDAQSDEVRPCAGDDRCPLAVAGGYEHVGMREYSEAGSFGRRSLPEWAWRFTDVVDQVKGGDWETLSISDIRVALMASETSQRAS